MTFAGALFGIVALLSFRSGDGLLSVRSSNRPILALNAFVYLVFGVSQNVMATAYGRCGGVLGRSGCVAHGALTQWLVH